MSTLIAKVAELQKFREWQSQEGYAKYSVHLQDAAPQMLDALSLVREGDASEIGFAMSDEYAPGTCNCAYCKETTKVLRRYLELARLMEDHP